MDRSEKKQLVEELGQAFSESTAMVVVHYKGLTVAEMTDLRGKVRAAGARFKVSKNRLTKRALENTPFSQIAGLFVGPTAIAYSNDPIAAAKVLVEFAKQNEKLVLLGGAFGAQALDAKQVETLSKLPSLDELRAKIIGILQTPASRIASVLQAPGGQVARVLNAYATK